MTIDSPPVPTAAEEQSPDAPQKSRIELKRQLADGIGRTLDAIDEAKATLHELMTAEDGQDWGYAHGELGSDVPMGLSEAARRLRGILGQVQADIYEEKER